MNKEKNILYKLAREYVKRVLSCKLGKIVEEEDRLLCYVDKRKCEKQIFTYTILCNAINDVNRSLAEIYGLNKPIYYIIDGLDFKKHQVYVFGYNNTNVIIRNCNFAYGIYVSVNGTCLVENSSIRAFEKLMISANDLTIKDINIQNELKYSTGLDISMSADNELNIINSQIGRLNEKTDISLIAGEVLIINDSKIVGDNINCKTNKFVNHKKSMLKTSNKLNFMATYFEPISVESSNIILNGVNVNSNSKSVILKQITNPLSLKRLELIELLKMVKEKCEIINLEAEIKYKDKLVNKSIIKTYRKG